MATDREVKNRRRENRVDVALIAFWLAFLVVALATTDRAGRPPAFEGEPRWVESPGPLPQ